MKIIPASTELPADVTLADPETPAAPSCPDTPSAVSDWLNLTKPRMNFLVVVTTLFGFYIAERGSVDWLLLLSTLGGTALTAASASVFNQVVERRWDRLMPRTATRPLAAERVPAWQAGTLGWTLGIAGVLWLGLAVNLLTAALGLATLLLYVFVYTPLKRVTPLNTLVGAIPGAIPPLMGHTAVVDAITPAGLTLFAILFVWQMPHFYAIAILYRDQYAAAGFKMLPCVENGMTRTRTQIVGYSLLLLVVSVLPWTLSIAGDGYLAVAVLLGTLFGGLALNAAATAERADARRVFVASILYLPLLLAALTIDKL
jgi:protoheme IX farnesyltransferase